MSFTRFYMSGARAVQDVDDLEPRAIESRLGGFLLRIKFSGFNLRGAIDSAASRNQVRVTNADCDRAVISIALFVG
jgi:hypothetical protein